jgi:hypothetical protein
VRPPPATQQALSAQGRDSLYLRDPVGYLVEIGEATGMLHGIFADRRPEDG